MNARDPFHQHSTVIRIGAAGLLLFNLAHWFVHPATAIVRDIVDGASGVFMGVAIGSFLMAIRLKAGQGGSSNCAG